MDPTHADPRAGAELAPPLPPTPAREPVMARAVYAASALQVPGAGPAPGGEGAGSTPESRRLLLRRPEIRSMGEGAWVVRFRYGALTTVGLTPEEHRAFMETVQDELVEPLGRPEVEDLELWVGHPEGILALGGIGVTDLSEPRLLVVAEVLARSAALTWHEHAVAEAVEQVEPLALRLRQGKRPGVRERALLRQVGGALLTQTRTVGRAEVTDRPEILWDHPELDRFYDRLASEFELVERERALTRKLAVVGDVSRTLFDLLQERRILRVEWYIVILILVEILLTLWEMFVAH